MSQTLTAFFVLVLAGYWYRSRSNFYRIDLSSSSNYVIFYESAITGGIIFFGFWFVLAGIKVWWADCDFLDVVDGDVCWVEKNYPFQYVDSLIFAAVSAYVIPKVENKFVRLPDRLAKSAAESGLIPTLILEALNQSTLVEITTFRRKSYVGWITKGPGISTKGRMLDVAILPLHSGYRDESDLTLLLTTDYTPAHVKMLDIAIERYNKSMGKNLSKADFAGKGDELKEFVEEIGNQMSVVLPLNDIASIRPYIPSLKDTFDSVYADSGSDLNATT